MESHFPHLTPEGIAADIRRHAERHHSRREDAAIVAANGELSPGGSAATPPHNAAQLSPPLDLPPLVLQADFQPRRDGDIYHVHELLRFHDQHFVQNAYLALLARPATAAELSEQVQSLRGGRAGKIDILQNLLATPEALRRQVRLTGFAERGTFQRLGRVPLIGYALRLLKALLRLPVMLEDQKRFETYALGQQQQIADYVNFTVEHLGRRQEQLWALFEARAGELRALVELRTGELRAQTESSIADLREHLAGLHERASQLSTHVSEIAEGMSEIVAGMSEMSRDLRQLAADLSGGTTTLAHTAASFSGMRDDLLDSSETIVMLADSLAGLQAASAELSVPKSLMIKQRQIEAMARSLADEQQQQAAALRQLIVQEQLAIVEAQKAALAEIEMRLDELRARQSGAGQ